MAGSGKTTLLQRLSSHLHTSSTPGYIINLDPAVTQVPYGANIDIRDTVCLRKTCMILMNMSCVVFLLSQLFDIISGQLQECHETIWPGAKRWHSHIAQSFCHKV